MRTCIYIVLRFNSGNIEMMMDRNTFFLTLTWLPLFLVFSSALVKKGIETDESALLVFKSHISLDSNSTHLLSNWTEGTSVCTWIGVQCSSLHNRVVALNVSNLGLHGTIPPQLGNLSFLGSIDISSNNFLGQLPREMSKLRRLKYMNFSVNNIGGDIPGWLGSLSNLRYLDLGNNTLSGALPSSFFNATKLEYVSLGSNQLNGRIPEEVGNLGNLRHFSMEYNPKVEGSLPLSFSNLSSLQIMAFTGNRLSGELPLHICSNLPKLTGIYLSLNQFSGSIQSRFDNCSKLRILSLSYNSFTGPIPKEIGNLTKLVYLDGGDIQFQGGIPPEFGNLRNLEMLGFRNSSLSGRIPNELSNLEKLSYLDFGSNFLSGPIPVSIFNLSSLSFIGFHENNLSGSLPHDIGLNLPNLKELVLFGNRLTGVVPNSISNLTNLTNLALAKNQFTGPFPSSLGNLRLLLYFFMFGNFLTSDSSKKLTFLESLTNCRYLERISLSENPLNLPLPPGIGNFSSSLGYFDAQSCGISGTIPHEFGNLSGLIYLSIGYNNLIGHLPQTIQKSSNLQELYIQANQITGLIPNFLCTMRLYLLSMTQNQMYGQVPRCFGNLTSLTYLYLGYNRLNSTLPTEIGNLKKLLLLDVYSNFLSGNITPAIGGLTAALSIDLSENEFSGNIPLTIGALGNLVNLSLSQNHLQGPIPDTFKNLLSLEMLDLSHNNLTGEIPETLETLSELKYLNVSFNHFNGRVPSSGSFLNFGIDSFIPNDALCGGPPHLQFPLCDTTSHKKGYQRKKLHTVMFILIPIAALVLLISGTLFMILRRKKNAGNASQQGLALPSTIQRVSYYEILRATNGFNESNLLGTGSFGTVFKGILRDGTILAIKVFNLQLEGAFKSFETECEIITNVRHKNLLKVISSCSNLDFKALILEYMPNGSLQRWLYSHNCFLDFLQRLNIMIDVASALEYLHHGNISPIVHCDLKPSNVLLDEDMNGHVSDFGISKLLGEDEIMVRTMTLATIGYTAPEYGSEGIVSTRCDIYSFGILLMETFTRRKPTDDIFGEGYGLREMIKDNLQNSETEFIDQNLIHARGQESNKMVQCIVRLMDLALRCAMDSPEQRADVSDVSVELHKIKLLFLSKSA